MDKSSSDRYNKPWRYALTMFGLSIIGYMYTAYGTFFYNVLLGLPMQTIALGTLLFAIWDAFNDPCMGFLSDRTRTRFGRRRPWLLVSVPLFMLASIMFFSPPEALGSGTALAVFYIFFLLLTETANTIASVNYHSLLPELFREEKRRNRANAIRQALQLVGMIIGVSMVPLIADQIGYQLTAVFLGVLGGGFVIYSILGCRERNEFSSLPQPKIFDSFKAVAGNRNFWFVSISHFFYQATAGLLLAGIPFFVMFTLEQPDGMAALLSGAVFVTAIPSMLIWYKLINRFGTLMVWRIALAWLGLSTVPMFFANDIIVAALAGMLIGIGIAGVTANLDMVNSELIEEDAVKYNVRREATFFASISFITRLSGLVRSGVFLLLFIIFAFESGDNPGEAPGTAARFMMVVFPGILMVCSFVMSLFAHPGKAWGSENTAA